MSYRKITVDDVEYEYVVGRTHLKVKGLDAILREEVGERNYIHTDNGIEYTYSVKPSHVKSFIKHYRKK